MNANSHESKISGLETIEMKTAETTVETETRVTETVEMLKAETLQAMKTEKDMDNNNNNNNSEYGCMNDNLKNENKIFSIEEEFGHLLFNICDVDYDEEKMSKSRERKLIENDLAARKEMMTPKKYDFSPMSFDYNVGAHVFRGLMDDFNQNIGEMVSSCRKYFEQPTYYKAFEYFLNQENIPRKWVREQEIHGFFPSIIINPSVEEERFKWFYNCDVEAEMVYISKYNTHLIIRDIAYEKGMRKESRVGFLKNPLLLLSGPEFILWRDNDVYEEGKGAVTKESVIAVDVERKGLYYPCDDDLDGREKMFCVCIFKEVEDGSIEYSRGLEKDEIIEPIIHKEKIDRFMFYDENMFDFIEKYNYQYENRLRKNEKKKEKILNEYFNNRSRSVPSFTKYSVRKS